MGRLRSFFKLGSADMHTSGFAQVNQNATIGSGGGAVPQPSNNPPILRHQPQQRQYKDSLVVVGYREEAKDETEEAPYMRNERLRGRQRQTSRIDIVKPTRQGYNAAKPSPVRSPIAKSSRSSFVEPPSRGYNPYQ